jgi:hypothetical protein
MAKEQRQVDRPGSAAGHAAKVEAKRLEEMAHHDFDDLVQWLAHGTGHSPHCPDCLMRA